MLLRSFLCIAVLVLGNRSGFGETGTLREYALKAGVLYHILEYVEWPEGSNKASLPEIRIGLLGQIPFPDALEVLNGKTMQGRKILVKRLANPAEAADYHVLFIGASEKSNLPKIVQQVKAHPILTVGEIDGFAAKGGMINLVESQNNIVMEINNEVAREAHLTISSQLLKLAKVYQK